MSDQRQNIATPAQALHFHSYTAFGSDIVMATDAGGPANGKCARRFIVLAAGTGTLILTTLSGADKTIGNCAGLVGTVVDCDFTHIKVGTNVAELLVFW